MGWIKKQSSDVEGSAGQTAAPEVCKGDIVGEASWEFLTARAYEDGQARETGTLLVFYEDGLVKMCVIDRDNGRTAFLSSPEGIKAAFQKLEKGIREEKLDWRRKRDPGPAKGKRT